MKKSLAVVIASGGLDSCVCCGIASREHDLALMHVRYGQRTEERELRAFHAIAQHYQATHRVIVSMDHFRSIGGSSLTDATMDVPLETDLHGIPNTYVPFRNANLLAAATSFAEVIGANHIFIGVNAVDSSGYPDCRPSFIDAFNALIAVGTRPDTQIRIVAPLLHMNKCQIVQEGLRVKAPIEKSWSCYINSDFACGRCDSCRLRLKGFAEAGYADPIAYAEAVEPGGIL